MNDILTGKKILITGGTGALGSAFVRQALGQGAVVFFTWFRSEEKAKDLVVRGAKGFRLDLTDLRAADGFLDGFAAETDSLDVLIHNAAVTADGRLEKMPEADWDRVLAVNLKAPFYLTRKLLPLLMKKKGDSPLFSAPQGPQKIFMVVSRAGTGGLAGASNYAASKGGLIAMMKSLAKELGRRKVLVNAVNPGFMRSSMTAGLPEEVIQNAIGESPLKTLSDPEEVAGFLVYLCSDLVKQVTGQVFHFESRPL